MRLVSVAETTCLEALPPCAFTPAHTTCDVGSPAHPSTSVIWHIVTGAFALLMVSGPPPRLVIISVTRSSHALVRCNTSSPSPHPPNSIVLITDSTLTNRSFVLACFGDISISSCSFSIRSIVLTCSVLHHTKLGMRMLFFSLPSSFWTTFVRVWFSFSYPFAANAFSHTGRGKFFCCSRAFGIMPVPYVHVFSCTSCACGSWCTRGSIELAIEHAVNSPASCSPWSIAPSFTGLRPVFPPSHPPPCIFTLLSAMHECAHLVSYLVGNHLCIVWFVASFSTNFETTSKLERGPALCLLHSMLITLCLPMHAKKYSSRSAPGSQLCESSPALCHSRVGCGGVFWVSIGHIPLYLPLTRVVTIPVTIPSMTNRFVAGLFGYHTFCWVVLCDFDFAFVPDLPFSKIVLYISTVFCV